MDWLDGIDSSWIWLTGGLVLAGLEMLVPGVYLIWLALAAIATGLLVLGSEQVFGGDLPGAMQVISFVFLALIFAFSARRWLRDSPIESADPMLNHPTQRMVGKTALVTHTIEHGSGRIKFGDSEWMAQGPDSAIGARVRITGSEGTILLVEPLNLLVEGDSTDVEAKPAA